MLAIALTSLIVVWMLVIALVVALCASARRGDLGVREHSTDPTSAISERSAALPTSPQPERAATVTRHGAMRTRHGESRVRLSRAGGAVG